MKGIETMSEIYVEGERVPCVNEIVYLGPVSRYDRKDTLHESVVMILIASSIVLWLNLDVKK